MPSELERRRGAEAEERRQGSVVDAAAPDTLKAIRALGYNPEDPRAHALMLVCQRYNLDPFLKHVSIYKDQGLYVHAAAYIHLANQHTAYEGYRIVRQWDDDKRWWAEVEVYRRGWRLPSVGRASSAKNKQKKDNKGTYFDEDADEKAVTKALRRALRRAFNVDWPHPYYEANPQGEPVPPSEAVTEVVRRVDDAEPAGPELDQSHYFGDGHGHVDRETGEVYDYGPDDDDPPPGGLGEHGWPPEPEDQAASAGPAATRTPAGPAAPTTSGVPVGPPAGAPGRSSPAGTHGRGASGGTTQPQDDTNA
jgi:hypothetical protein